MKLLLLDNYDSFTYNLVQCIRNCGVAEPLVRRNDKISIAEAGEFEGIILSPGPGVPSEAGIMPELVKQLSGKIRILGVCLGHQCIGEVFGAGLINMDDVIHGKALETEIVAEDYLFSGVANPFLSARYHSWMVSCENFPGALEVTARDPQGRIMAIRHREFDVRGVQFHPESILTPEGQKIVANWISGGSK